MKRTIEIQMNEEGFPCLRRKFHTKFWSKLLQRDAEGKVHEQDIIDSINDSIEISKRQSEVIQGRDDINPFKQITRKLQIKMGAISKLELLSSYMEGVKKDLIKNMGIEFSDNITMATSNEKEDTCIAGESQSVHSTEEMNIETSLQQFNNQIWKNLLVQTNYREMRPEKTR
ncbi:hypothetical protein H5410_060488 [Solanum commersonii]|uniref:Uncharacterized protein n=1 Tax=Solanum commersonii TaxID=4109 RepID=A0A9J5W5C7_SOLCO|nr:hypothetical protein H5410_060488 [Solanum commersonii]